MNVLFISNDPSIFDPESPARDRMRSYAASIGTLHVLSRAHHKDLVRYRDGVQEGALVLVAVGGGKITGLLNLKRRARSLIEEVGIELVSAQDPFEHGWVAFEAVKGTQAKLHLQVHTDFCSPWFVRNGPILRAAAMRMPLLNTVRRRIADRLLPKADGIRTVSERVKASMVERYGDRIKPITVIPIAVGVELPAPVPLPAHPFSYALLTVARLEPEKRIEDAIDTVARLARTYPMLGLIVVGEGRSRQSLTKRARALGISDRVVFLGWRNDAKGLMRSAQAYLQTSAYEGYGLSLIEAALARVPIITTDVGIVGEVFTGYEDLLVAPVADSAALAVHVTGLIEDVQARTLLVMHAELKAKEHVARLADQPAQIAQDLARTIAGTLA